MGTGVSLAVISPETCCRCFRERQILKDQSRIRDDISQLNSIRYYGVVRFDSHRGKFSSVKRAPSKFYGQAERAISTRKLHALLRFHIEPIKQVVFLCPSSPLRVGRSHLEECFPLICIQRLSQPNFATQPCSWHYSWNTRGSSIPVLSY